MKLTLLLMAATVLATPPLLLAAPVGWELIWSDEFDKPGQPDPRKWGYEEGLLRNHEKQYYTRNKRENARVEDGKLIIEAHRKNYKGGEYTSASVISRGKASWTGGRFEIRAKVPAARGTWPAIWMLPEDFDKTGWPRGGEIDLMEHVGYDLGKIHGSLHSQAFNHTKHNGRSGTTPVPDAAAKFHVYGMEWSADKITFEVDGKTYATFQKKPGDGRDEWPFDRPFYLIMNLAIGGDWGGQKGIDEAAFPQRMEIDYVRVYKRKK